MKRRHFLALLPAAGSAWAQPAKPAATSAKPASGNGTKSTASAKDAKGASIIPTVTAKAAIVVDAMTGHPYFQKNADDKRQVASTQKLLTALLLSEAGNLDRICIAAEYDAQAEPTKLFLKPGQQYSRRELLKGMLMKSANDAARCLARNHAGTEPAFAQLMNRRAAQLGMKSSQFQNASGLPAPEQHSTARDMSLLARAALMQPIIRRTVAIREDTFTHPDGRVVKLTNTNSLLTLSPYCHGMKTGFTDAAGKCLVSCGSFRDKTVIVVMLGSAIPEVWRESKALLHWALGVA